MKKVVLGMDTPHFFQIRWYTFLAQVLPFEQGMTMDTYDGQNRQLSQVSSITGKERLYRGCSGKVAVGRCSRKVIGDRIKFGVAGRLL